MATITTAAAGNWSATATWTGSVLPGISDTAKIDHVITLDINTNIGGVDPTGTGYVGGTDPTKRVLVGDAGRPQFILKAVVV